MPSNLTGTFSQSSHLTDIVLYNNDNLVFHSSDSPTIILPDNTTAPRYNDGTALLNDLHFAPLIFSIILTVPDSSEEQIGNSPTDSSDEISVTLPDFPLVARENADDLNRDMTSIDNFANNTTIVPTYFEDAKFVSNPTGHNEREMVTRSQKGIYTQP